MDAKEIRKQNKYEKLGTNNPVCVCCGETDWRCFEGHHIAGKAYTDDIVNICCNCHRKVTDDQKDHPKKSSVKPSRIEIIGRLLLGLADFFELIAPKFREFGCDLIESARMENVSDD